MITFPGFKLSTVPMWRDDLSFRERQHRRFNDLFKTVFDQPMSPENQWLGLDNPFTFNHDDRALSNDFGGQLLPSIDAGLAGWMKQRRDEWNAKVQQMENDFHKLHDVVAVRDGSVVPAASKNSLMMRDVDGTPKFKATFDVRDYPPGAIKVTVTDDRRLEVEAKFEEKSDDKYVSRQFHRSIKLPDNLDEGALRSVLSMDGVLAIEAPISAPKYLPKSVGIYCKNSEGSDIYRMSWDIGGAYTVEGLKTETKGQSITVSGRLLPLATAASAGMSMFKQEVEVPTDVDTSSVVVYCTNGRIVADGKVSKKAAAEAMQ